MRGAAGHSSGGRWAVARSVGVCVLSWGFHTGAVGAESAATAAALKRDSAQCLAHAGIDACDDAVRRSPNDPQLLVALGDAEVRSQRFAGALRHYQRAAQLAPGTRGLNTKISAMEARLHPKKPAVVARREPKAAATEAKLASAAGAVSAAGAAGVTGAAGAAAAAAAPVAARGAPPLPPVAADTADVAVPEKHYSNEAPAAESH